MMNDRDNQEGSAPPRVDCALCRRQIPRDEALASEGEDYVLYFCGSECFERWRNEGLEDLNVPEDDPRRP